MIASISVSQSHRASDGQQGPVIQPTLSQPIAKWGLHIISHFAACYTILNIQGDLWERRIIGLHCRVSTLWMHVEHY